MTEHEVLSALRDVYDPEVGLNIVDLGLVYSTAIDGSRLRIAITMTTPACPMHAYLTEEVRETLLSRFEQLEDVEVELVWDPPWSPEMISTNAREQLGWR